MMQTTMSKKVLPCAIISDENSLIICQFRNFVRIDESEANTILYEIGKLAEYMSYGLLTDARELFFITSEARNIFGAQNHPNLKANAIIVASRLQRDMANLYFTFAKPQIKTKMFSSEEDARAWLELQLLK